MQRMGCDCSVDVLARVLQGIALLGTLRSAADRKLAVHRGPSAYCGAAWYNTRSTSH